MSGTIKIALAVVAALLIFGGVALVGINSQGSSTNGSTGPNASPNLNATQDSDVALTITYTGKGFEPNLSTIKANNWVRVRNRSIRLLKFASDPYPDATANPELNTAEIRPGDNVTFYVTQKGSWGYHNALDPSETGHLNIQ